MRVKLLSTFRSTVREFHQFIEQRDDLVRFFVRELVHACEFVKITSFCNCEHTFVIYMICFVILLLLISTSLQRTYCLANDHTIFKSP